MCSTIKNIQEESPVTHASKDPTFPHMFCPKRYIHMVRETGNRCYTELFHYHRSLKGEFYVNRRNLDDELLSLLINKEIVTRRVLSETMKV